MGAMRICKDLGRVASLLRWERVCVCRGTSPPVRRVVALQDNVPFGEDQYEKTLSLIALGLASFNLPAPRYSSRARARAQKKKKKKKKPMSNISLCIITGGRSEGAYSCSEVSFEQCQQTRLRN